MDSLDLIGAVAQSFVNSHVASVQRTASQTTQKEEQVKLRKVALKELEAAVDFMNKDCDFLLSIVRDFARSDPKAFRVSLRLLRKFDRWNF